MRFPRLRAWIVATATVIVSLAGCGDGTSSPTSTTEAPPATTQPATTEPSTTLSGTTTTSGATVTTSTTLTPVTVSTVTTTSEPPQSAVMINVTVTSGAVKGPGRVKVALGDTFVLTVTADVPDEVHVHGYDVFGDVAPGLPAVLKVEALIPGVFEVELEGARLELVVIEVK